MKHSKWKTKIISVSGYLVKWTHMKIKAHIHSGWAAAHAAIVKGCRRVIWKAFGKEVSDPKALQQVWNGCNTCNSNNELTTCGVLRLRPAENVTDTTRGRKPQVLGEIRICFCGVPLVSVTEWLLKEKYVQSTWKTSVVMMKLKFRTHVFYRI